MISRRKLLIEKLKGRVPEGQEDQHADDIINDGLSLSDVLDFYDDYYADNNFIGSNDSN